MGALVVTLAITITMMITASEVLSLTEWVSGIVLMGVIYAIAFVTGAVATGLPPVRVRRKERKPAWTLVCRRAGGRQCTCLEKEVDNGENEDNED